MPSFWDGPIFIDPPSFAPSEGDGILARLQAYTEKLHQNVRPILRDLPPSHSEVPTAVRRDTRRIIPGDIERATANAKSAYLHHIAERRREAVRDLATDHESDGARVRYLAELDHLVRNAREGDERSGRVIDNRYPSADVMFARADRAGRLGDWANARLYAAASVELGMDRSRLGPLMVAADNELDPEHKAARARLEKLDQDEATLNRDTNRVLAETLTLAIDDALAVGDDATMLIRARASAQSAARMAGYNLSRAGGEPYKQASEIPAPDPLERMPRNPDGSINDNRLVHNMATGKVEVR